MKRLSILVLLALLCLAVTGVASAEQRDLVEWDTAVTTSDPPGTVDSMDQGNPNECKDTGSLNAWVDGTTGNLICEITNGYPGYQEAVYAAIINVTNFPVEIAGVEYIGRPPEILARLTDTAGGDLVGRVIDGGSSLDVWLVSRVRQAAEQDEDYRFEVRITVEQAESGGDGGDGGTGRRGSISGMKFNDLDGDGVKDPGEPGMANWTIRLSGNGVSREAVTDENGRYSFKRLRAGTYTVSEVQQDGWEQTYPAAGSHVVELSARESVTGIDFGNCEELLPGPLPPETPEPPEPVLPAPVPPAPEPPAPDLPFTGGNPAAYVVAGLVLAGLGLLLLRSRGRLS